MIKISKNKTIKYVAIIALLVVMHFFGLLSPLEGYVSYVLNPLLSKAQTFSVAVSSTYNKQASKTDFAEQSRLLENQLNDLLAENSELKVLREENEIMRKYIEYFSANSYSKVMSGVISKGNFADTAGRVEYITIDKGLRDGLKEGLAVVNENGLLIGKISSVKDSISEVSLIVNSKCKLAATIIGEEKTSGIVEGNLGLTMKMGFIPQSKTVEKGEVVVSSGLEENIPRGLVIGKVTEVLKESNELWQEAVLESSVDLSELMIVAVLLPELSA